MLRRLALTAVLAALPLAGAAQDRAQTLADIRAELGALGREIAALRAELVGTGQVAQFGGGSALARMDAIESELVRLTARTEDLEFRIQKIVQDGTNRLGDLEFRIVELEGGDLSSLGNTPPLGGDGATAGGAAPSAPVQAAPQTAVAEQADFDRAREVLGQRDFRTAADLFAAYAAAWPGGPLTGEALLLRGEALEELADYPGAARAYLESFSGYPDGPHAGEALFRLGRALGQAGQVADACIMLGQVELRYPANPAVAEASVEMGRLGCN
ncbi:tetratricopeptide repeat protein [Ruixingdingia sedimenti]|uniref:Cell division coordinator CpoB n=1 Tax=Ruixingdingia sedimenti TaxID=3073604 RepID=A0ABU1FBT4_9RHOB|nr:tetratricopeptide repeat protein [Xinfangfangia sp. LG-4]MDR5654068.1 tetratricopeptide repeat protein [Xinfangfangia sp. LG-4]